MKPLKQFRCIDSISISPIILFTLLFASCGGGGDAPPLQPPPNLAGVWAGSWTGFDPTVGNVGGTWVNDLTQSGRTVGGIGTLRGDIDCMDGILAGSADANNVVTGTFDRSPCLMNQWALTAVNLQDNSATGAWTQNGSGAYGTLTGKRISVPGGPRIRFVNPPGGASGGLVTVVGENFAASATLNTLTFNTVPATLLDANTTTLVVAVPGSSTTGSLQLNALLGNAKSPLDFNRNVGTPNTSQTLTISDITTYGSVAGAEGITFSPDGRKAYVSNKQNGRVNLINTASDVMYVSNYMNASVRAIRAHPDGRWVYAIGGGGIMALEAGTGKQPGVTIPVVDNNTAVSMGTGADLIPDGLAISPDGRYLYAIDNQVGGKVVMMEVATKKVVASYSAGAGMKPLAVAAHPGGKLAYFAFEPASGVAGTVAVIDVASSSVSASVTVGRKPQGMAVTPDGAKLYVANNLDNTVSVIDTGTNAVIATFTVGLAPLGVAISPDGSSVYIANYVGNSVSVFNVLANTFAATVPVGSAPSDVAISADGSRAYVVGYGGTATTGNSTVTEIGGPRTLTVYKYGTGIGTVTSIPVGIDCGTSCQARYPVNTSVQLIATPASGSYFSSWSGNCSAYGQVTMTTNNLSCGATFNANAPVNSGGGGGHSHCFIATAAFGSDMADEVITLRKFRDEHLLNSELGRSFVDFYYRNSPPIADYLRGHETMRTAVRWSLKPVVFAVRNPLGAFAGLMLIVLAPLGVRRYLHHTPTLDT